MEDKKNSRVKKLANTIQENYLAIIWAVIWITVAVFVVWNWDSTSKQIGQFVSVLAPFLVAVFIAYLIMPLMGIINKIINKLFFRGKARKTRFVISMILAYITFIGIIVVAIVFIVPQLGASLKEIDYKKLLASVLGFVQELQKRMPFLDMAFINEKIQSIEPQLMSYGTDFAKYIFPMVYDFSMSVVSVTVNVLLSIVISCYLIIDKKNIMYHLKRFIYAITPKRKSEKIWLTIKECNHIFNGFLIGKTLDSFIIGVICFVVLTIFRFPYALLVSVIVGITNMIPYFGPFIGAIPGIILYALVDIKLGLMFSVIILAIQQFDGLYLGPKILGDLTGLKPLWVIFAITVGGAYFGPLGMFLGVPVVAVISYLLNIYIEKKLKEKDIQDIE